MTTVFSFDVSFENFFKLLFVDEQMRNNIINKIKNCNYEYAYLEFPGLNKHNSHSNAEFVLIKTTQYPPSNPKSFIDYFIGKSEMSVVKFANLSGDTTLISISPSNTNKKYNSSCSDIMSFFRFAPQSVIHSMLISIGLEMTSCLKRYQIVYLSTHGRGIPWLHIRICISPKYYTYIKYINQF